MLYFWNPNDSLISNMMMIPTPSPSCSYWSPFFGHRINSRGPSVSPFSWFSRYELSGTDLPYSKGFRKFGCPELSKKSLTLIQLFFVGGAFDPDPDADPYEILVSPPNYFFFFSKTRSLYGVYFQTQNWEKSSFFKCADIHKYVTGVIFHISSSSVSQHAKVMRQQKKIIFKKILPTIPEDQYLHRGMGGRSETENLANVNFIPKMEFKSLVPPSAAHLQLRWKVIVASRKYCTHYWQISTLKDHWRQISTLKCFGDLHPLK